MLLPHGYEGQGAEHSSARLERFLTLCAELNMFVCNVTTPANYFHMIRRQLALPFRKPLVVMSPKSLLRHPKCVSELKAFTSGTFEELIDDNTVKAADVKRVVFCTGKLYYELLEQRDAGDLKHVALVRIEQLYPFPMQQFEAVLKKYNKAKQFVWAQEEPENMGAWMYLLRKLRHLTNLEVVARAESGSPATGSSKRHAVEQKALVAKALGM
jgi:2-oxoglutarate dehydrogenase E1 component